MKPHPALQAFAAATAGKALALAVLAGAALAAAWGLRRWLQAPEEA